MEMLGIFRELDAAVTALEKLLRAGFVETQLTSLSSAPYPHGVLSKTRHRSWLHWLTLAGAVAGTVAGFGLSAGTAWLYPVQTGDKPIIALYPAAIVTFEVAMLCAIIGCMTGMFLDMKLSPTAHRLYDPAIADGCIGIHLTIHQGGETVQCQAGTGREECIGDIAMLTVQEQLECAVSIMEEAGAVRVIREVPA
jgi:hypothetical protein